MEIEMLVDICSSNDWKELSKYVYEVEMIVEDKHGEEEEKEAIRKMVGMHLALRDQFMQSPFTICCGSEAPVKVILQLLYLSEVAVSPAGSSTPAAAPVILTNDETPEAASTILISCASRMSLEGLQELIFYHLEKMGIEGTKVIATKPDSTGTTPLLALFTHQYQLAEPDVLIEGLNKIQLLRHAAFGTLEEYKQFAHLCDYELHELKLFAREYIFETVAMFPFACIDDEWIRSIDYLYESIEELRVSRLFNNRIDPSSTKSENSEISSLHASMKARHPLHSALEISFVQVFYRWGYLDTNTAKELIHRQNIVVSHLIDVCPESAIHKYRSRQTEIEESTSKNTSLLCHAIKCGLWWDGQGREGCKKNRQQIDGPIKKLSVIARDHLISVDPETGLYPFMYASVVDYDRNESVFINDQFSKDISIFQLSTVYALLKEAPETLSMTLE